jgi:hypothetical protein
LAVDFRWNLHRIKAKSSGTREERAYRGQAVFPLLPFTYSGAVLVPQSNYLSAYSLGMEIRPYDRGV